MPKHQYDNACQQRILNTMLALFGHEIDGLSPSQIAQLTQSSASNVTRDLHNLEAVGVVERLAHNNNARITPMLGQKALAILGSLDRASQRIDDTKNRFTRTN
ncbi:MAG: MarR family transcriptional regulator [Methylotenera sp.]|nr:MarR family transcriptional regulator [Methylotenera sp.]